MTWLKTNSVTLSNLRLSYSWPKKPYLGWYLNIGGNVIIYVSLLVPQAKLSGSSLHCVCCSVVSPWTTVHQAPLFMGFSRQEYWSEEAFPCPGDLRNPGIKPTSLALQAYSLPSEPPGKLILFIIFSFIWSPVMWIFLFPLPVPLLWTSPPGTSWVQDIWRINRSLAQ